MRETIQEILDNCPTHGFCTNEAHIVLCLNEDHRKLASVLDNTYSEIDCLQNENNELEEQIKDLEEQIK